jgi:hypothetical protein
MLVRSPATAAAAGVMVILMIGRVILIRFGLRVATFALGVRSCLALSVRSCFALGT